MVEAPLRIFLRTLEKLVIACAASAIGVAILDVARAASRDDEAVSLSVFAASVAAAIGLYGGAALVVGIICGVIAGSARVVLSPDAISNFKKRISTDEDFDLASAAGALAVGAAAMLLAALVFAYVRGFALDMASKRNGALSSALVAVAALPVAAIGWFPFYLLMRSPARLLPRPRALVAVCGMAAVAMLGVVGAVLSVDWRVINFGPALALGVFLALVAGHLWFWNGPGESLAARVPKRSLRAAQLCFLLLLSSLLARTLLRFGNEPRSLSLVAEQTAGARPLLLLARHFADRDHDGYSALLGGGDCDDHDPDVNPGAIDIPGNGRDEDCSGDDEKPDEKPTAVAPTPPDPANEKPAANAKPQPSTDTAAATSNAFTGNLLIITIDTLRADRLNEKTMPHLSAFAKDAVVFTHAYAQAPNTPRSFPSFLTSRYPSQIHWARASLNFSPILDDNETFFETLRAAGLRTIGKFSHFYLDPKNGVSQGFDEWDNQGALTLHDSNTDSAAPRITPKVVSRLRALSSSKQRFALWTHYFEPHSKYMDHAEFPVRGQGGRALEETYDGEVSFVDQHIQKILDELRADGLDKNTCVVIFSDHGEAFGEHRFAGEQMFFHGQTLYDELLRVPLLVRLPGVKHRVVDARVMLLDLAPTLVDLVGRRVPANFVGRSLLPSLRGEPVADEKVYAEMLPATSWQHSWRVLIDGKFKILDKISENTIELYDLSVDRTEQHNLALSATGEAARMKQELRQFTARLKSANVAPTSAREVVP